MVFMGGAYPYVNFRHSTAGKKVFRGFPARRYLCPLGARVLGNEIFAGHLTTVELRSREYVHIHGEDDRLHAIVGA